MQSIRLPAVVAMMAGLALLTGCAATVSPVGNHTDIQEVDFSKNMKTGKACSNYILGLIGPFGDASVVEAAKSSNISHVAFVDYHSAWYLILSRRCVQVYGSR